MKRSVLPWLLLVLIAILFGPLLLTTVWHLRHGRFVSFGDKSFKVPLGWYAHTDFRTIYISKLSPTVFSERTVSAIISLWPATNPPKNDDERDAQFRTFVTAYLAHLADKNAVTTGPILTGAGNHESACMQSSPKNAEQWTSISCLAYGASWFATFYGEEKDANVFHAIIDGTPAPGKGR
jgi:hypothetical protein